MRQLLALMLFPAGGLLAAGAPPLPQSEGDDARPLVERTWDSCAACHAAPDHRVQHDARWIGLNRTTTCLTDEAATDENRTRLIAWLAEGKAPRPRLVRPRDAAGAGTGRVRVPATSGSAFLRRTDGERPETLRLFWDASEDGSFLSVPGGEYDLVGYCFYREDDAGVQWTASATVQEGQEPDPLVVKAAGTSALAIRPVLYHDLSATAGGTDLDISFQMRNEAGDRMTLTRAAKLVEPEWVATAEDGSALASGRFVPS